MEKITYSEYYMVSMDTVSVVLWKTKPISIKNVFMKSFSQPEISLTNF